MGLGIRTGLPARLEAYDGELTELIGHADRKEPLRDYCTGCLDGGPAQGGADGGGSNPGRVSAQHPKLPHFGPNSLGRMSGRSSKCTNR